MSRRNARRARRGTALVASLGMLMLGAGLLAGAAVASVELVRASRALAARTRADTEGRYLLGDIVQRWGVHDDSLAVGTGRAWVDDQLPFGGPGIARHAAVQRYAHRVYGATVDVVVGDSGRTIARRQLRLLLERQPASGSSVVGDTTLPAMRALARWSLMEQR